MPLALGLLKWGVRALAAVLVLTALAVFNNNYALHQPSRAEFSARLDHAIDTATAWIVQHPEIQGNPPLMFMIGDMAEMSGDARLKEFVRIYLASPRLRIDDHPVTWYYAHWVDPTVPLPALYAADLPYLRRQDRWFAYATAPDRVQLPPDEQANFFSPTQFSWGIRLHLQLIALDLYRHYHGESPELKAVLVPVTDGVARDAYWDFRVSDSYYQRAGALLAAGRPDLIKPRWMERILDRQNPDGSWNYCWYGWCRGVFEFSLTEEDQGHATVQAAWALYLLKYRCPEWISQHFH